MKVVIVGMGIQGLKRKKILGKNFCYSVDSAKKANFKSVKAVPTKNYDTVFICVPDEKKYQIAKYCLQYKKNILVEKPFLLKDEKKYKLLKGLADKNNLAFYTAYNHRFEPGLEKIRDLIAKKSIGKIYRCRIFYGNGTSLLVKKSKWRDKKLGVISDIGSHLIDICMFIFGKTLTKIKLLEANKFENKAYDHSILSLNINSIRIELEMTLCSWENTFNFDIIGSKGSIHMNSLCKWSDSNVTLKLRKYPSGFPKIKKFLFRKGDPTWKKEHSFFKKMIRKKKNKTTFSNDILISNYLKKIK